MSDKFDEIAEHYRKDVLPRRGPINFGLRLFSIPEYPEDEASERGMWSAALETILTTLRYLAPATLLTLFWGQQSFLFRLLRHIDLSIRAIVFSSEEQKQSVLKWVAEAGPVRVEQLDTVWRHGWVLCGVLDAAMPGACAGHPPTRQSLKHAQTIADHYLGVDPVFTRQELESNDCLSRHQEWKLAQYLDRIRQALAKIPPPVSRPTSQRTSPTETTQFTLDYVARGSGLTAAQINNKVYFKIYPTTQQSLEPGEITILIRGPKDTYGMVVVPPILGRAQMIRQKLLHLQKKTHFTENMLPITQGATYLRTFGRNDMNRTFHIPKTRYDIEIEVEPSEECTRIGYLVSYEGRYEISIVSRGLSIVGSPFSVTASHNIIGILERESFCLEDGEEIDIVDVKTDKKVVLRIVDFVTEKMLLKENGALEKITNEEVNNLLTTTDNEEEKLKKSDLSLEAELVETNFDQYLIDKTMTFKKAALKVITLTKTCKVFNGILKDMKEKNKNNEVFTRPHSRAGIPDVVNSTLSDSYMTLYEVQKQGDYDLKSENKRVSTVKDKVNYFTEMPLSTDKKRDISMTAHNLSENITENLDFHKTPTLNNSFLEDIFEESYITEAVVGSHFIEEASQENISSNERLVDIPIQIFTEEDDASISPSTNPFIDPELIERPKTPVLKIITGDVQDREDSVYVDPVTQRITEEIFLSNEFINPLFIRRHQASITEIEDPKVDFIIGAPVSLPPIVNAPSPEMDSILITNNEPSYNKIKSTAENIDEISASVFSTPLHTTTEPSTNISSTFHSLDSTIQEQVEEQIVRNYENNLNQCEIEVLNINKSLEGPKIDRDTWDSAYVSIDDLNNSPDSNNNEETATKVKFSLSDGTSLTREEYINMGPAERDLWESCAELSDTVPQIDEEIRGCRYDKRLIFTPILEENDKTISTQGKKSSDSDPVTVAFAELNDIFQEYTSNSEHSSITTSYDDKIAQSTELEHAIETSNIRVESASESESDVMRPTTTEEEGTISEVQANVTESVSASRSLHTPQEDDNMTPENKFKDHTEFGEDKQTNIVLEKKKYWDEKIREIEQNKSEEPKRKRLLSKNLRHNDSLSKRRGKQMVQNFLIASESSETNQCQFIIEPIKQQRSYEEVSTDAKLVEKWKKYWDEKLETETEETQVTCFKAKTYKVKGSPSPTETKPLQQSTDKIIKTAEPQRGDSKIIVASSPVKQELPEEMFKAFETSPKRFFGTSRKQILNKIDSFLGKASTVDDASATSNGASQEKGIVSSRISLFHNISQVEELPLKRPKSHSMHNIYQSASTKKNLFHSWPATSSTDINKTDSDTMSPDSIQEDEKQAEWLTSNKETPSPKNKRLQLKNTSVNKSLEESVVAQIVNQMTPIKKLDTFGPNKIRHMNQQADKQQIFANVANLRKSSVSKSEMDISCKTSTEQVENDLDKYKSCDDLPKINVKNFISMYETVTEIAKAESKPILRKSSITCSVGSEKQMSCNSSPTGATTSPISTTKIDDSGETDSIEDFSNTDFPKVPLRRKRWASQTNKESISMEQSSESLLEMEDQKISDTIQEYKLQKNNTEEKMYVSTSDIELEIIERTSSLERYNESSPERDTETLPNDYRSRFKLAKKYFQSLEELRVEDKIPAKRNECQQLLYNQSTESPESDEFKRKKKITMKKSHSLPSSEFSKIWTQMQESDNKAKLVKISEKFNIDDLFTDVTEGKLSRQGSLRGIPHKKAVLEAFKSMENIADTRLSSYEITVSQLTEFAKENQIKNAQTYLTDYPYLPTTDPSKYHSRLDTKASGLISLKELLDKKPRRNSVPDLRLNKFTVDL